MLLLLVFCMSMVACSSINKDFDAADALLQAGDYDAAIAAFSAIGRYEEISAKIQEAQKLKNEANAGFLYGTWKNILNDYRGESDFVIMEDGKALIDGTTATYSYENGILTLTSPMIIELVCEEIDGVMHLRGSLGVDMDYVPEDKYDELGPYSVELTMDNWTEYFELREAANMYFNQFGELESAQNSYGIFLKDEYMDKISLQSFFTNEIAFKISYDTEAYAVPVSDYEEAWKTVFDINELEKTDPPYYFDNFEETGLTTTASVWDYRNHTDLNEKSPYYKSVAAEFGMGGNMTENGGTFIKALPVNAQVVQVQGELVLFR